MIKPKLFSTFLILSASIILSSCGGGGNSKHDTAFGVNTILAEERMLSTNELQVATNICYSYKSKSQRFRTTDYGKTFNFKAKFTDCQVRVNAYDIATTLKEDPNDQQTLFYFPPANLDPSLKFNRRVQTDTSGYLSQLCPKVLSNQPVQNTTTLSNVKIQIAFKSLPQNMGRFELMFFNRQVNNSFKFDSVEIFEVPIAAQDPNRGMDQYYSNHKVCTNEFDKAEVSVFEQTFISQ